MVGVDAHFFLFRAKRELTAFQWFQLMVRLQVRPAPHSAVYDVGKPLAVRHLQPPVQGTWDRDAFTGLTRAAQSPLQFFHGSFFLL